MRFIYVAGRDRQKMHIMLHNRAGEPMMQSLCGARLPFDRSINAPWTLGKGLCKVCQRKLEAPNDR